MKNKPYFDINELENKHKELKTIKNMANYYSISESTLYKKFKQFGITFDKISKFNVDDNFFSVDTEESFYIAGFIAADGCIKNNDLVIKLSSNDKNLLEIINNRLKSDRIIKHYDNNHTGASELIVSSKKICNDLKRFNIVSRKSLTYTFPEFVKTHFLKNHFMRGYSDGDGSFYIHSQFNKKICFGLRGTVDFLTSYRSILEQECNFIKRTYPIPVHNNYGQLSYGGNKNIIKLSKFLYNNESICLDRKKKIALQAEKLLK
jgi:hypothetical protein